MPAEFSMIQSRSFRKHAAYIWLLLSLITAHASLFWPKIVCSYTSPFENSLPSTSPFWRLHTNLSLRRDTGLASIEALVSKRGGFDYILLETSGLANPGNLAPLFWTDDGLGSNIYLDGIVSVVDAKNILTSLSETPSHPEAKAAGDATENQKTDEDHAGEHLTTAHLQISHADVIVLNKADTVTPEQLATVRERVRSINGLAKIHVTQHSKVPYLEGFLLDLHAYDGVKGLEEVEKKGHSHIDPVITLPPYQIYLSTIA